MNLAEGKQTVERDHEDQTVTMDQEFYRWLLEQAEDLAGILTWWGAGPETDINDLGRILSRSRGRVIGGLERRTKALGLAVAYRWREKPGVACFIFSDASRVISVAWSDIEADAFLTGEEKKNAP